MPTPSLNHGSSITQANLPVGNITHNVRNDNPNESRFPREPPCIPTRRCLLSKELRFLTSAHPASIIFHQEALTDRFDNISSALGPDWIELGVGRDDGDTKGERVPIFHRKDQWKQACFETMWLNPGNEKGEKGWGAGSVRIVTCVVLEALSSNPSVVRSSRKAEQAEGKEETVLLLNTHLDNASDYARLKEAQRVLEILAEFKERFHPGYWVVGGDLNSEEDGDAYKTFSEQTSTIIDGRKLIADEHTWGEELYTYTGFNGTGDGYLKPMRIDFVFVPVGAKVDILAVVPNEMEGIRFTCKGGEQVAERVSDHRAVVVDVSI